ncbi:hypothetical protein GW17_00035513 [Ensete ventricosum]|nr:hypothetical protein GW17_00035513 [Ensete ventricosum]
MGIHKGFALPLSVSDYINGNARFLRSRNRFSLPCSRNKKQKCCGNTSRFPKTKAKTVSKNNTLWSPSDYVTRGRQWSPCTRRQIARHLWDCSSLISKQHLPSKVINDDRHSSRIVPVSLEKGRGIATWRRWASRSTIGLGLELGTAEAQLAYDQVRSGWDENN